MPTRKKLPSKSVTDSHKVRDYSNDPFVLEKGRRMKAFIDKNGLPEAFTKK
ncbi:MAG: hypothetical protein WDO14_02545 [Bacteroidota bacterium]